MSVVWSVTSVIQPTFCWQAEMSGTKAIHVFLQHLRIQLAQFLPGSHAESYSERVFKKHETSACVLNVKLADRSAGTWCLCETRLIAGKLEVDDLTVVQECCFTYTSRKQRVFKPAGKLFTERSLPEFIALFYIASIFVAASDFCRMFAVMSWNKWLLYCFHCKKGGNVKIISKNKHTYKYTEEHAEVLSYNRCKITD